jgi:alkylation response protein AidB-like acyl-CoA dehydrogenase
MSFDFSIPQRVAQWRDRITGFVDDVVIPREQDAFAKGVDDALRAELGCAAKAAGLWAPQAPAELGGGGFAFGAPAGRRADG